MLDLNTKFGRYAKKYLKSEYFIWLTTVDSTGTPQPRPVWFIWEADSVLIFTGIAKIDKNCPPANKVRAYLRKYKSGIIGLNMTLEKFSTEYSVALRITPTNLRGWE